MQQRVGGRLHAGDAAAHALLFDVLLGFLLQLIVLLFALVSFGKVQWLQNRLLLEVKESVLSKINEVPDAFRYAFQKHPSLSLSLD